MAAAADEVVHLVGDVGTVGEHGVLRAQVAREGQRRRRAVDRDYGGTERDGDLHGAEAHAADPTTVTHSPGFTPARALNAP
jgi:hypothetical protein